MHGVHHADVLPSSGRDDVEAIGVPDRSQSGSRQPVPGDDDVHGHGYRALERLFAGADIDALPLALETPALAEVLEAARHLSDVVVGLDVCSQAERLWVESECLDTCVAQERVALRPEGLRRRVLRQAVDDDHVPAGELLVPGDGPAHEPAVVNEELQVEGRDPPAGFARARGRVRDVALPRPEAEVRLLDRVEERRRAACSLEGVREDGVSFELAQLKRRLKPFDDDPHEIGEHVLRVLELGPEQVARVAGDVRDDERAALGGRKPGVRSRLPGHLDAERIHARVPTQTGAERSAYELFA